MSNMWPVSSCDGCAFFSAHHPPPSSLPSPPNLMTFSSKLEPIIRINLLHRTAQAAAAAASAATTPQLQRMQTHRGRRHVVVTCQVDDNVTHDDDAALRHCHHAMHCSCRPAHAFRIANTCVRGETPAQQVGLHASHGSAAPAFHANFAPHWPDCCY